MFFSNMNIIVFGDPWKTTCFPKTIKKKKSTIIWSKISKSIKQRCYVIISIDIYLKNRICNDIQYTIRQTISTSKAQNLALS
jgi:hypothetical protein